jgi:hypothetical protein
MIIQCFLVRLIGADECNFVWNYFLMIIFIQPSNPSLFKTKRFIFAIKSTYIFNMLPTLKYNRYRVWRNS